MDLEQEYSPTAAAARERRVREQRQRTRAALARSAQPIERPDELIASVEQLAAALGAKVKRGPGHER